MMNNITKIYLDDIRFPHMGNHWIILRSYNDFVDWIQKNGLPDEISFDHDLASEHYDDYLADENWFKTKEEIIELMYDSYTEKTGYDAARWLCDYCEKSGKPLPKCYVHSANPVGAENILKYINNYKIHVEGSIGDCVKTFW